MNQNQSGFLLYTIECKTLCYPWNDTPTIPFLAENHFNKVKYSPLIRWTYRHLNCVSVVIFYNDFWINIHFLISLYFTRKNLRVEGFVTSQYEFWTDASFVLISILMKRRELNLGFEDWDSQSPSTQCQVRISAFIKNGIPRHEMKTAISMLPIMSGNNLKEYQKRNIKPLTSNINSGGSKKKWHAYSWPDHLQILKWIKNYSLAYHHG